MRTKGAVSSGLIKLSELNTKFANPDTMIVVSRKFAKLNGLEVTPIEATTKNIEATVPVAIAEVAETAVAPEATAPAPTGEPVALTEVV